MEAKLKAFNHCKHFGEKSYVQVASDPRNTLPR